MSPDHWAVSTALVATSALALVANALLLLVFFRRRGLRTVSNRFVINLLVTNLLSSVVLIPLLLVDQELQPSTVQPSSNHLILRDLNTSSSSRLEIDLQVHEEVEEDIIPRIRHLEHYLRTRNISQEEKNETAAITFLCYLSGGSTSLVCTASILSILLIAIDQYFAVTHPLRYHTFIDKFKSLILLISTWLISLVFGILGAFVHTDSSVWNFCVRTKNNNVQYGYNVFYAFTYLFLVILVPFVVICVIYGCIYCAAHRNSERMRKSNSGSSNTNLDVYIQIPMDDNKLKVKVNSSDNVNQEKDLPKLPKVKSAPNFANLEKAKLSPLSADIAKVCHANSLRSNASFINSLKTKISNASLFRYREETRAAKISILVIFMVLVCYVPFGLALVLNSGLVEGTVGVTLGTIALTLLVTATLLSPFLFAYRNRRIRRELRRVLGLMPRKEHPRPSSVYRAREMKELTSREPFLPMHNPSMSVPEVVVTCKPDHDKKSILKRVCSKGKTWGATKKCNFISVPECLSAECRCSFSSASTQISSEEYSVCN